jgi:bifunctional non-homologous end joining protein LigD
MGLTKYHKKRKFTSTNEPPGKVKTSANNALIFVVQQHHASHLHYDFRLEMEGVLKSWAVPKGPSMNPDDKRLAMMVEDHPYDYKDFEGHIPDGNYGAGNVIVWDNGTYQSATADGDEHDLLAGLKKGHLNFILKGKKLKGEFSLVKLRGKQENAWLLIKKNDKYATEDNILSKTRSVISRRTLEMLDKQTPRGQSDKNKAAKPPAKKAVVVKKKPGLIRPMMAKLIDKPFDDMDWLFEVKYDGYRALALCDGNVDTHLYSRNLLPFNGKFPTVVQDLSHMKHPCLLDGEVVVENSKGISGFQLLQNYQTTKKGKVKYYVFDLLQLNGEDTTGLALKDRKQLLDTLLKKYKWKSVIYSTHVNAKGTSFFEKAQQKGWEGIIGKRIDSTYHPDKRNGDWVKIKITNEQEAIIVGITEPKGEREAFGSLLLAVYDDKRQLQYIGKCGTGFDTATLKELYKKFKPLFSGSSPFKENVRPGGKTQWLKPVIVCQVKFTEWTEDGHMRHPVYLGLREDKKAKDVKHEKPEK